MKRLLLLGSVALALSFASAARGQDTVFNVWDARNAPAVWEPSGGDSDDSMQTEDDPSPDIQSPDIQLLDIPSTRLDVGATSQPSPEMGTTRAATQPEASSAAIGNFPTIGGSYGLREFANHFAPYQPMYFIAGTQEPDIKFQLSIRYRILTPTAPLAVQYPWLKGFNFAYTQTSLWNISKAIAFYDTGYKPEFFYYLENVPFHMPPGFQLGAQLGVGHESNGLADPNHRSINMVFVKPIATVSTPSPSDLFLTVAPKLYEYIGDRSLNPDIARYRGYADIQIVAGQRDGLQLAVIGRVGSSFNRGSAQFDITYPLTKLLNGNMDISLDVQYFTGYGESLLTYNQRHSVTRIGVAIVR
ncbi:MAG: phospholipase A [Tepidisphaeraceae bacterium]